MYIWAHGWTLCHSTVTTQWNRLHRVPYLRFASTWSSRICLPPRNILADPDLCVLGKGLVCDSHDAARAGHAPKVQKPTSCWWGLSWTRWFWTISNTLLQRTPWNPTADHNCRSRIFLALKLETGVPHGPSFLDKPFKKNSGCQWQWIMPSSRLAGCSWSEGVLLPSWAGLKCCWRLLLIPSAELEIFVQFSPTVRHPTSTSAGCKRSSKKDQKWSVAARQRWWSPKALGSRRISCSWGDMQQLQVLPPATSEKLPSWTLSQAHWHVGLWSLRSRSRSLHCLKARKPAQHTIHWLIVVSSESKFVVINLKMTRIPTRNQIYQMTSEKEKNI